MRNSYPALLSFLLIFGANVSAQADLKVHDVFQIQLRVMQQYGQCDSLTRAGILADSVYTPYREFWEGYVGSKEDFLIWSKGTWRVLPALFKTAKELQLDDLKLEFQTIAQEMKPFCGYAPQGSWYLVWGPAWTDLGSLSDGIMLIDLSHPGNSSKERIVKLLPHEFMHQIVSRENVHQDTTALASVIGEGFAVWVNQKFWKDKYTLADNLGYTETELALCEKNLEALKGFLASHAYSTDKEMIDLFRNRSARLNEKLPGAIGYYLGYKIVQSYVAKFGADSWKEIITKSPKAIYEQSGF